MLRVRTVRDIHDFLDSADDPDDYSEEVKEMWASGESHPHWCFVIEDGESRVGRVGFRVEPTVTDPAWVGSLPPDELFIYGLDLPWTGDFISIGQQLFEEAAVSLAGDVPDLLEIGIANEVHSHAEARRELMESMGFHLFHEKQGFFWKDDGTRVVVPERLKYRSFNDVSRDTFGTIMGSCGEHTLDRNDRHYWKGCGAENWGRQMTAFVEGADEPMWLIGYAGGEAVGCVAVGSHDDWGSTIVHIGVLPEHRGHGYIDDLMAAATAAVQRAGISSMLSDVDVENQPMIDAMLRAGHRDGRRPWHVWVYRTDMPRLAF
jgi:ribosomal protein S18 acetylase RimI-like enzyme